MLMSRDRANEVTVLERDSAACTYGWGVVFWGDLLDRLRASDPESAEEVERSSFRWRDQIVRFRGAEVNLGGTGFSIGRQRLLEILRGRARKLGVRLEYEREITDLAELADRDLIVGCDGANSRVRRLCADRFETSVEVGRNKYIWLGTSKVFDAFTFSFVETPAGWIWFHGYGFDEGTSTCVVECPPETWSGLGFDRLGTPETMALLGELFASDLDRHPLLVRDRDRDRPPWLSFRTLANERWHHANVVLVGDAAHTTHFTIGSGTSLAIEDAIELASCLRRDGKLAHNLAAYEANRRTALAGAQAHALNSAGWFERLPIHAGLEPEQFALLLNHRFSELLARLPSRAYLTLDALARKFPRLRTWSRRPLRRMATRAR
jgi:2-polyprenyl-6-methoxyphenol hydroxylase-like FAD-dependent oxidoreductase